MSRFQKATKKKAKLRAAVFGPSGSGKTYSALRVATGIARATKTRIAVVDTERGSASKYSDRFDFDVAELEQANIANYCDFIREASGEYGVLVIDSLSHGWHELLQEIDQLAKAKYKGNTWSAWSDGTPKQRQLVDAILSFDGHIIATMRSKTEWTTEANNGKSRPVRVGLAPEQGKGIEYEFDLLLELSTEHIASVLKDRTGKFQDQMIEKPGEDFGQQLAAWLNSGEEPPKPEDMERQVVADVVYLLEGSAPNGCHIDSDKVRQVLRDKNKGNPVTDRNRAAKAASFIQGREDFQDTFVIKKGA